MTRICKSHALRRRVLFALLTDSLLHGMAPAARAAPLLAASTAAAAARIDIAGHVAEAAQRFGIPEHWIYAVMRAESGGRVFARSSVGAMGLMQLMPSTWSRQRARLGLGDDPFDPRDNILAGASYLRELYDSYGAAGFLAAYNAGPRRYEDWRAGGRPLPAETRNYVARIAPALQRGGTAIAIVDAADMQAARRPWTFGALFAGHVVAAGAASSNGASRAPGDAGFIAPPNAAAPAFRAPGALFVPVSGSQSR